MEEEQNKHTLEEKLREHYLDLEQTNYLIGNYTERIKSYYRSFREDEILCENSFLEELSCYWAAEDLMLTDTYKYYVSQMLIKQDYAYLLRDYYIAFVVS